jgi:integrative and conjugative element protein (TIGR02256 family)
MKWNTSDDHRIPVVCLMNDRDAERIVCVVVDKDYSGGTWDVLRKAKLETLRDPFLKHFADAFFPTDNTTRTFQPEPGCSEPTFTGSSADSAGLASIGLNMIASGLSKIIPKSAISAFFSQPGDSTVGIKTPLKVEFTFSADFCLTTGSEEIRVTAGALQEMKAWIEQNRRLRTGNVETGGLAWGEWDDATGIIWINSFSGPPPDSSHSPELFVRGVAGTKREHEMRIKNTRHTVGYIGEWHTHPVSRPLPSLTDIGGIHQNLTVGELPPNKTILMIVGKQSSTDTIGAYIFRRAKRRNTLWIVRLAGVQRTLPKSIL